MKTNTKEKILKSAGALFAKNGYNGVSVRQIARAVGIKEASIYNHFVSKEEILHEILDRHENDLEHAMPKSETLIAAYDRGNWKPAWAVRIKMMKNAAQNDDLNIIMILMNEQYRLPKARHIVKKYYIDEPVRITCDLLKHIHNKGIKLPGDAMTLARAYQYPIFCMVQEYEMALAMDEDIAPILDKMKTHIDFFWKTIIKHDYED